MFYLIKRGELGNIARRALKVFKWGSVGTKTSC